MEQIAEEVDKQFMIAREAIENSEYDRAITILKGLLDLFHESGDAVSFFGSLLGVCYLENNEPLQALLVLKNCPPDEDINILRTQLRSLARAYSSLHLYEMAIQTYQKYLELETDTDEKEEAYYWLSFAYSQNNQWDETIAAAKEGLIINPSWYRLKYVLSMAYLYLKDKQQAIVMADELKSSQPSLAEELYEMIENDNAEQDKKDDIEANSKAQEHYLNAREMLKHGEQELAMNELIEALGYGNKFANAYTWLGTIYDNYGLLDEGLTLHRKAVEADSKCALAYNNIGYVLQTQGDTEGALNAYKKALEIDPDLVVAHNSVGVLYDNLGDYEKGISHFLESYRIEPDKFSTHSDLGFAYRAVNEIEKSLFHYKKAVAIEPANIDLRLTIGDIYKDSGRIKEAEAEYLAALDADPNSVKAWVRIIRYYFEVENREGLLNSFNKIEALKARDHKELLLLAKFYDSVDEQKSILYWQEYVTLAEEVSLDPGNVALAQKRVKEINKNIN